MEHYDHIITNIIIIDYYTFETLVWLGKARR